MEQTKNMEQAGAASVVSTEKKNESRKRDANGKDVLAIRSFLESLNVYEADALRVGIAIADGKPPQRTFLRTTALRSTAISTAERTTSV